MKKLLLVSLLVIVLSIVPLTVLGNGDMEVIDESGGKTLEEGYGVYTSPHFYGMFGGWSGTAPLIIINGKDKARTFEISIEVPNKLVDGYKALPPEYYSWIVIASSLVTASAGETIKVPVTITIPDNINYVNRHDQIAFQVKEAGQGFIQLALQSYWFITSDPYEPQVGGISRTWIIIIAAVVMVATWSVYFLVRRRQKHAKK